MGHIIIAVTMCFFFIQGFFTNLPKCEFPCFFSLGYFQDWFQVFVTSLPLTEKYLGSDLLWANILPTKTTESFKNDHGFRMVESFPKSKGKKTRVAMNTKPTPKIPPQNRGQKHPFRTVRYFKETKFEFANCTKLAQNGVTWNKFSFVG